MSCRPPFTLVGIEVFDGAKLQLFSKLDKKMFAFAPNISKGHQEIFTLRLVNLWIPAILDCNVQNRLLPRVTYGEDYLHVVSWDEGRVSGRA